ncbi:hypothetical protein F8144_07655 [Streptomyces triticiradicis]|uniref:Uncharacterized protein n=1 Tax=Streptomyces triticiradicis TaxID=2651189 RepID=A0A7J5DLL9_9ACTN|nr:hypothetical protein [Streptomyces triticiradicis]KAB1989625.1 hypothetical protein F8144_07655 [Streptomyces triticiradicis]
MSTGVPLASGKGEIFELVLKFMPDWVQVTVLALVVLAVVGSWIVKLKRKIQYWRAVRAGRPVHAAAQYGQGRGADYLGAYAPQQDRSRQNQPPQAPAPQTPAPAGPSGADFLGSYAPGQDGAR